MSDEKKRLWEKIVDKAIRIAEVIFMFKGSRRKKRKKNASHKPKGGD